LVAYFHGQEEGKVEKGRRQGKGRAAVFPSGLFPLVGHRKKEEGGGKKKGRKGPRRRGNCPGLFFQYLCRMRKKGKEEARDFSRLGGSRDLGYFLSTSCGSKGHKKNGRKRGETFTKVKG